MIRATMIRATWAVLSRLLRWRRRVPVMLQLNTIECGAACLAMVLTYHGHATSVLRTRQVCTGGRGGVSAAMIAAAARSYGMRVRGLRPTPELYGRVALPAIVHWQGHHFVVVERCGRRFVTIVDPAVGRRRLTVAEFLDGVSQAVLVLEPGPEFVRVKEAERSTLRTIASVFVRLPGVRGVIAQVLLATVLLHLLGLALPVATMLIVDEVFGRSRGELIWLLGAGLFIALVAQVVTTYLRSLLLLYLQGRLDAQVLTGFAQHMFRLPLRYFHQRTSGDIMSRLTSVAALRDLLTSQTVTATLDAALVVTYLAIVLALDPPIAAAMVVVLLLHMALFLLVTRRARDLTAQTVTAQVSVNEYLVQTLRGVATIKATGAEQRVADEVSERIYRLTAATLHRGHLAASLETAASALRLLTPVVVLWLGALRVIDGHLSIGTMLGLTWLAAATLGPLTAVLNNLQRLQNASIQTERLGDIILEPSERAGAPLPISPTKGSSISLRGVSFRYDAHSPLVLRDISATIEPGQRIAIVGRSGAGKTTLALLLLALHEPTSGQIRIDGVDLGELDPAQLRRRFGVVLQDPFTMRATIRDNITLARDGVSLDDIVRAGTIAQVHDEVMALPLGYDTWLAEHGVGLSGGQLQRLALARALVGRPAVLVLDEATSHLDAQTEREIVANLRGVDCTQIVIAHRLSTVAHADRIFVLHDGHLVESGTHAELLARGGHYADLVSAQMGADSSQSDGCRKEESSAPAVYVSAEGR